MANLPNQTLYVNNLNDKIHKEELRRSLYFLFSQFGPILDVVALKTPKMRGQAFIAFKDITCATNAMRALQSFNLFGKPMKIAYAKSKSIASMKEDGTYQRYLAKQRKKTSGRDEEEPATKAARTETGRRAMDESGDAGTNKILYVSHLPPTATKSDVHNLFAKFEGLVEVRMVDGRPDMCFVEYETARASAVAMQNLDGFSMGEDNTLSVTYAKK
ncbi:hypothetical protein PTSG_05910 [Salpingoeca rosetta]|uniref:RRM domain-containing protein n=1 Tax=Salpingoeca rosetta (strain ATCC 50818 / BSB-021) TaxID=946362 RepID=F2UD51_SALR5|nr:uncharacterized protein PTSG_05910 [Salpingoeca rosetta]EGD74546.1 hypothetical protein PTSG_05910 [Salpingoeca rosetta]|eukprot:XP_004992803.1 hypothetical protein PTSG_05910 [Salpingoeca rosetta]